MPNIANIQMLSVDQRINITITSRWLKTTNVLLSNVLTDKHDRYDSELVPRFNIAETYTFIFLWLVMAETLIFTILPLLAADLQLISLALLKTTDESLSTCLTVKNGRYACKLLADLKIFNMRRLITADNSLSTTISTIPRL